MQNQFDNRPKWLRNYNHKRAGLDIIHFQSYESNTAPRGAFIQNGMIDTTYTSLRTTNIINYGSLCKRGTNDSNYTFNVYKVTCMACAKLLGFETKKCKGLYAGKPCKRAVIGEHDYCESHDPENKKRF